MNYWLLTTEYPPAHGGGISTYCRCTAEMLAGNEILVTVIVADDGVSDYIVESFVKNIVVVRFNPAKRAAPPELGGTARLSYAFYLMVGELISELGTPDIIESQDYLGIAYYLQQFKLLQYESYRDIPVLITIHAPAFVYLRYNKVPVYRFPDFWTCEMEKSSIRAADLLISPSSYMAAEVGRWVDLVSKPPVILPYAYKAAGTELTTVSFHRNKIVYYGKLSPQKGSFELLRYFQELWEDGFVHPLHIIGGTDIVYHPEKLTMGQMLERDYREYLRKGLIVLHAKIDPACIGKALADAHVVLLPSIVDNLPFACLETLGCGKLVLASVQGGQREIITDGENGFLFDHSQPGSFGQKLQQILALSEEETGRIAKNAIASLDRYSYQIIAEKKLALVKTLVDSYRRPDQFPFAHEGEAAQVVAEAGGGELLSVVIPFFNLGRYLDECIGAVLATDYHDVEIIIVNDGSTEADSLAALNRWRDHPDVSIIDQRNGGLAEARNKGARKAAGRFLAFLDADDTVLPDYYGKAIRVLRHYENVHFAGCWVRYFDGATGMWPSFNPSPPYLLTHNTINSSSLVYETASFLAGGLNDAELVFGLEDYESVVSMVRQGFNGVALPECLYRYRVRAGSMFRRASPAKLLYSNGYIQEKHKAYYRRFASEVVQLLNSNGPGYLYENPTLAVYVSSSTEKPGGWQARLKNLARHHKMLKRFLLFIKKKIDPSWQARYNTGF